MRWVTWTIAGRQQNPHTKAHAIKRLEPFGHGITYCGKSVYLEAADDAGERVRRCRKCEAEAARASATRTDV